MMIGAKTRATAAALAIAALGSAPATAAGPPRCVTPAQVVTLTQVLLPVVVDAVLRRCVPQLPADAYLVRAADRLRAKFPSRAGANAAETRRAVEAIAGEALPATADDAALEQVFATGVIGEFGLDRISAKACRDASDIVAPLDPLPRESFEQLIAAVITVAARKDNKLRVCAAEASSPAR